MMRILGKTGLPLFRTQAYNFGVVGTNPYSKDAEVHAPLARTLSSRSTPSSTTPSTQSSSGLEEPASGLPSDSSSRASRPPASQSCSPPGHTQLQLRAASTLPSAICTTTIGGGTHTTPSREATGWETRMPSTTCASRLPRPSWSLSPTAFLSPGPRRERFTRGPSEGSQRSTESVYVFIFRTGLPYMRRG